LLTGEYARAPKSLHKLILYKNIIISNFSEVEMLLKCPKVVYLLILINFQTPYTI